MRGGWAGATNKYICVCVCAPEVRLIGWPGFVIGAWTVPPRPNQDVLASLSELLSTTDCILSYLGLYLCVYSSVNCVRMNEAFGRRRRRRPSAADFKPRGLYVVIRA